MIEEKLFQAFISYYYQIQFIVNLLEEKYGKLMNLTPAQSGNISREGRLGENDFVQYKMHGRGCLAHWDGNTVDFNFHFTTDGVVALSLDWLRVFIKKNKEKYLELSEFPELELLNLITNLVDKGKLKSEYNPIDKQNLFFYPKFNLKYNLKNDLRSDFCFHWLSFQILSVIEIL